MEKPPLNLKTVHVLMSALGINSYSDLARRMGDTDRTYLSRVLRGQRPPQPSIVLSLARALKVAPVVLLGPDDPDEAEAELVAAAELQEAS